MDPQKPRQNGVEKARMGRNNLKANFRTINSQKSLKTTKNGLNRARIPAKTAKKAENRQKIPKNHFFSVPKGKNRSK